MLDPAAMQTTHDHARLCFMVAMAMPGEVLLQSMYRYERGRPPDAAAPAKMLEGNRQLPAATATPQDPQPEIRLAAWAHEPAHGPVSRCEITLGLTLWIEVGILLSVSWKGSWKAGGCCEQDLWTVGAVSWM